MRVLFDFNNLACRVACREKPSGASAPSWPKVAFSLFGEIYAFIQGVHEFMDAGEKLETVLAFDSAHGYWRGDLYPKYKADREKTRRESDMDWVMARVQFEILAKSLAQCTPWVVLQVEKCEADDVIFTLSRDENEPVIIYSTDSDYLQLVNEHISLYMPHHDDYAEFPRVCKISGGEAWCENPQEYLRYAILTGQGVKTMFTMSRRLQTGMKLVGSANRDSVWLPQKSCWQIPIR